MQTRKKHSFLQFLPRYLQYIRFRRMFIEINAEHSQADGRVFFVVVHFVNEAFHVKLSEAHMNSFSHLNGRNIAIRYVVSVNIINESEFWFLSLWNMTRNMWNAHAFHYAENCAIRVDGSLFTVWAHKRSCIIWFVVLWHTESYTLAIKSLLKAYEPHDFNQCL